jgi:hypothetical protein
MEYGEAIVRLIFLPFELAFTAFMLVLNSGLALITCSIVLVPVLLVAFLGFLCVVSSF